MAGGCAAIVLITGVVLALRIEFSERMPAWHTRTAALVGLGFWLLVLVAVILGVRRLGRRWSEEDEKRHVH